MMLRALVLLSVALAGLGLAPSTHSSPLYNAADIGVLQHASAQLRHESGTRVLRWLRSQRLVRSVSLQPDGRTFDLWFTDGRHVVMMPPTLSAVRVSTTGFHRLIRPLSRTHAPGGRALLLAPFATQLGNGPNVLDSEVSDLHAAGFQVDTLFDQNVTVKSMELLSKYNVVYMQTHETVSGGVGLVATGQIETADADNALQPLVQSGSLVLVWVSTATGVSKDMYYAITATYIRDHVDQFPHDSLMFMNGCNLLKANDFWSALQSKGTAALVSWDAEASDIDNFWAAAAFFGGMDQGLTVAQAIQAEQQAGYGKSSIGGGNARLGYLGDGTVTLQRAAAGQIVNPPPLLSTPVPLPTVPQGSKTPVPPPTAVPTTKPAPTATATPGPGPSLVISLNHRVNPGSRQIIIVRSAPNTPVRFRVVYPTGDTQTWSGTTDSSGTTRYVYIQPANEVTYKRVFASVTIEAGNGATSSLTTEYRILWSKIDVSVQPHEQAVGQVVSIWVHARKRQRVTVLLHFPSGAVHRLVGPTGAHGWAHFRYRIQRYLKKGANRTVQVQVRSLRGQVVVTARTTFLIK